MFTVSIIDVVLPFSFTFLAKRKLAAMREEQSLDSGSSRMEESSVRTVLEKLCQELNMDEQTATEAMQNFTAIWATHTLEVKLVPGPLVQTQVSLSVPMSRSAPEISICLPNVSLKAVNVGHIPSITNCRILKTRWSCFYICDIYIHTHPSILLCHTLTLQL